MKPFASYPIILGGISYDECRVSQPTIVKNMYSARAYGLKNDSENTWTEDGLYSWNLEYIETISSLERYILDDEVGVDDDLAKEWLRLLKEIDNQAS